MSDSAMSQATFRLTKIIDGDGEVWYSQLSVNLFNERITELEHKLAEAEYQLEQQQIMNPIAVEMLATISDLSKKLKIAIDALEWIGEMPDVYDASGFATDALKEITNVSEKDKQYETK